MLIKFITWYNKQRITIKAAIITAIGALIVGLFTTCIGGAFAVIAAIISKSPSQLSQEQPTQTPVSTPEMPSTPVELAQADYDGISITIDPLFDWFYGKILTNINDDQKTAKYYENDTINASISSTLSNPVNSLGTIHIILTGKSDEEPVIVDNRTPIKVLSYQPNYKTQNIMGTCTGGAGEVSIMQAEVSSKSTNNPEQLVWATYRDDLIQLLREKPYLFNVTSDLPNIPSELIKVLQDQQVTLPDYFSLVKNEAAVISVSLIFRDPGIYNIQFGIQYTYKGIKGIAWVDQPFTINVFGSYNFWSGCSPELDGTEVKLFQTCDLTLVTSSDVLNYEYQCSKKP